MRIAFIGASLFYMISAVGEGNRVASYFITGEEKPGGIEGGIKGGKTKTGQELHARGHVLLSRPGI
jgi:hypothetical protein